jgi:hypothetical protein
LVNYRLTFVPIPSTAWEYQARWADALSGRGGTNA